MRIASFNVENLFSRARALNLESWSEGRDILDEYSRLNRILQTPVYTPAIKKKILKIIGRLGLNKQDESKFVILRQNRGHLLKRPKSGPPEVVSEGRGDWIGWLELKQEAVTDLAIEMTGRVIQDVNADILAVIEAEDRIALKHFNDQLLKPINAAYGGIMLIDGNDDRGIDVGLLTRPGYTVESMVSHVDDTEGGNPIFSRDCPEYTVQVNETTRVLILVNHFKSKGFGSQSANNAKRKAQAERVKAIYEDLRNGGASNVAVVGDFNDTPNSNPLAPLLQNTDLEDISKHPNFDDQGRPGTFGNGTASNKIDYILLSPSLFAKATGGSIFRMGVWGGTNGTLFAHFPEITKAAEAASDHAAIVADIQLA